MTREEIYKEMEEEFGLVLMPWEDMPDDFVEQEWAIWKNLLTREHRIPDKWRQLIWLAALSVAGDEYNIKWSTESAKMAGATDEEIREVAYLVKWVIGWAPFQRANRTSPSKFHEQVTQVLEHWEKEGTPDRRKARASM